MTNSKVDITDSRYNIPDSMLDFEALGITGAADQEPATDGPVMTDDEIKAAHEEYLNSPMGRIEQAIAALMFHSQTFGARLDQLERYVTYLLSKDPEVGPQIQKMAEAANTSAESNNEQGSDC